MSRLKEGVGLLVLLVGLGASGCQPANPMPGTWKLYVAGSGNQQEVSGSAEFRSDMSCVMKTVFGSATWQFSGTYSVKNSELTIDGEVVEDAPGGYDSTAQVQLPSVHRKDRLKTTGTISQDKKSFRIHGKNFIRE